MAVQIGKYKRPGIFLEEFDQSVIASPTVDGITNLVIGVSKKGPINTPILLKTVSDLESIFGQLDRGLERKASFFHRTISKMLATSPIYAINLLATDDNLDTIQYKSLSSASNYTNDIERTGPYRRFFDTTGFWKRDTESFINLTKSNTGYTERAFNLTNLSDRYITTFIFKTKLSGFDRTLVEWYGSVEKMPPYVSQQDYASDYMIDVVVVGGDWSDYQQLAVDPKWSAYFDSSGLRKDQVSNFANNRNVTLLAYYEGLSLIPYFRDANGKNVFVETVINRDTDKTGLFCAFNNDLVEADFRNGMLDLLGNGLVGVENTSIEFLSYSETITESIEITQVPLDLPGNVFSLGTFSNALSAGVGHAFGSPVVSGTDPYYIGTNRTSWFAEGYVNGVTASYSFATSSSGTASSMTVTYNNSNSTPVYAIIGGAYVPVSGTATLTINASDYDYTTATVSYTSAFVLDSTGDIVKINSSDSSNPSVGVTDIVLGYITFGVKDGFINMGTTNSLITMTDVSVNASGFVPLTYGSSTSSTADYWVATSSTAGSLQIGFIDTANVATVTNYKQYRRFKMFNELTNLFSDKDKMTMLLNSTSMEKRSLSSMSISNIIESSTSNKSLVLNTGLSDSSLTDVINGFLLFYKIDNELIINAWTLLTKDTIATQGITASGIVAKYSTLYTDYVDGIVNTGDYFYENLSSGTGSVTFQPGNTSSTIGYDYIVFSSTAAFSSGDIISIPSSTLNTGQFTIQSPGTFSSTSLATLLGYSGQFAFKVSEAVVYEALASVTEGLLIYDRKNNKHYIEMYLYDSDKLSVRFLDSSLESVVPIDNLSINNTFFIQSDDSNFKQSVEIEVPSGYVQTPNKILVNGSRYTEIKVGDFLEAYYDSTALQSGEVPRKLTRILSKRLYASDTSLVEITCDARIKTNTFGTDDLQTMRYTSIEDYVSTYKAISMQGFRIRTASLPDGTEDRQSEILNLVAKGTPLFKAITNKEAFDFRYLIDSFGLGLTELSKQQLMDICGDRLDCFGFINMPSMRSFKNSTSPSFVDADGVLQCEFIAAGGDPESNPAFLYSFGEGLGTTCTGYFAPYIIGDDNGRPIEIPPSSFVATTYMRKHISNISSMTPWTVAAGVTNGKITNISGLEISFTPTDIEFLNQAQMNPIVFKRNRGYVIETENTAQTLYKSALSYVHVREVLIELERELSRMLLDFQWKFNTPEIRSEIKLRADVICEKYVSKNGLYNYFNKIDEENNTSEVIDNQMGILDTYVEPIKAMGIIVNNITILRTGAIQSGGFIIP